MVELANNNNNSTIQEMEIEIIQMIDEQEKDCRPEELQDIYIDSVPFQKLTAKIKQKIESYPSVTSLIINNCELQSLDNFPNLIHLVRLELAENQLTGYQLQTLKQYTNLQYLSLGTNQIATFQELQCLSEVPNLVELDLNDNQIVQLPKYRETIFKMFEPNLIILDNIDRNGKEVKFDDSLNDSFEYEQNDDKQKDQQQI